MKEGSSKYFQTRESSIFKEEYFAGLSRGKNKKVSF